MVSLFRWAITLSLWLAFAALGYCQSVNGVNARISGQSILIEYELLTDYPCMISLYYSNDSGKSWNGPLNQCTGDVGTINTAGAKQILWRVLDEIEDLSGNEIQFKVLAQGWSKELIYALNNKCKSEIIGSYDLADAEQICNCAVNDLNDKFMFAEFDENDRIVTRNGCATNWKTKLEKYIEALDIWLDQEMVFVEGGRFVMGSDYGDTDERPIHDVEVSSFEISKFEVTQALWESIMGSNPSKSSIDCNQCPVYDVSWHDAQEFISRLNSLTKKSYRLPTEAEWEFAARGGNKSNGRKFSGSNKIEAVGWYALNSNYSVQPVGQKIANELGLFDMTGNVSEWCSDWYGPYSSSYQRKSCGCFNRGV
jgi:hypothetical protein